MKTIEEYSALIAQLHDELCAVINKMEAEQHLGPSEVMCALSTLLCSAARQAEVDPEMLFGMILLQYYCLENEGKLPEKDHVLH